jgi:hypothetical protein
MRAAAAEKRLSSFKSNGFMTNLQSDSSRKKGHDSFGRTG